jgi:hypothetical protein
MSMTLSRKIEPEVMKEFLDAEVKAASESRTPISRRTLTDLVTAKFNLPFAEAWEEVDGYCNESAPHVPAYLSEEIGLHWPKVIGALLAVGGIALVPVGISSKNGPLWYTVATLLVGVGAFLFVRSLESFQEYSKRKKAGRA